MPWVRLPTWKGTSIEATALNLAILNNCECLALRRRCAAHQALLDQRWLDSILFMRWMRERLEREEGVPQCLDI